MEIHYAIAELVRYTYVTDDSKFKDQCSSSREVIDGVLGKCLIPFIFNRF